MSRWGWRACAACGKNLRSDSYSRNQWRHAVGESRCQLCVGEGVARESSGFDTARTNNATNLQVDFDCNYSEGTFRRCYRGVFTGGQRTGQSCAVKRYIGNIFGEYDDNNDEQIQNDLDAVEKARHIITQWNQAGIGGDTMIRLNCPQHRTINGEECLVEPWIDRFFKINSNSGWTTDIDNDDVNRLQALSHYSYHITSGQFVLCDLQGGFYRDGIILTDPVILSRNGRYGATDLGAKGISSFFYHHRCNRFCRPEWTEPRDKHPYHAMTSHTFICR